MTMRKRATAALFAGFAVAVAACGAGASSHVVQGITSSTSGASTSTTITASPGTGPVPSTPTTAPSGLNPQTLDQVAAELGALDNSLSTANSDLNNPQGDS
jgi:hypothetical protein